MAENIAAQLADLRSLVEGEFRKVQLRFDIIDRHIAQLTAMVGTTASSVNAVRNAGRSEFRLTQDRITEIQMAAADEIARVETNVSFLAALLQGVEREGSRLRSDLPDIVSKAIAPAIAGLERAIAGLQEKDS